MTTRLAATMFLTALLGACGGDPAPRPGPVFPPRAGPVASSAPSIAMPTEGSAAPEQALDRQVIFRGEMELTVEDPMAAAAEVESLTAAASGYVDRSQGGGDDTVEMTVRLPAASLADVRAGIRPLGQVDRDVLNTTDVTGRVIDLEARLQSATALRDRLRSYIDRATNVADVITIERELTRVQTEIEAITAELQRTRGLVAMAALDVTLDEEHTLGPVAYAGVKVGQFFKKLVVWN